MQERHQQRVAAVDCGTNSTRLLILDPDGSTHTRLMCITRLGQGVDATGRLAQNAIDRTVAVLRDFRRAMDDADVGRVRLVATSAARDAGNSLAFLDLASRIVGGPAEILDGRIEGEIAAAGATQDLPPCRGVDVILDIGGGSTELVVRRADDVDTVSLDVGCVRVTERFLHGDPPTDDELREAESFVSSVVAAAVVRLLDADPPPGRLIGLAGTVTTLAALELGLEHYDPARIHHSHLTRGAVDHWYKVLSVEPASERSTRPAISAGREDVIVGGVLILRVVMDRLGMDSLLVSEHDVLDGLAQGLLNA